VGLVPNFGIRILIRSLIYIPRYDEKLSHTTIDSTELGIPYALPPNTQASDRQISSWVGEHQQIPAVVYF
jgi:hypothetical protein